MKAVFLILALSILPSIGIAQPIAWHNYVAPETGATSAGSSRAARAPIRSSGTSYARCVGYSGNRSRSLPFVFTSERGSPFTTAGFARMMERAGREAKFGFKVHPHMLRHACGFALANKGHDTRAKPTWATRTFSTPFDIPSWRRDDLKTFGGIDRAGT